MSAFDGIFRWARASSLVPLAFVGAVGSRRSALWLEAASIRGLGDLQGAGLPRQADVLVVVGDVTQKSAPLLQRLHARMADPSYVLHVRAGPRPEDRPLTGYALVQELSEVLPVDVVIEGDPPDDDALAEGLALLRTHVRAARRAS
jgi:NADH:ubiquinone oxidoreductase subunit B-like Fe-S oxidoreductase